MSLAMSTFAGASLKAGVTTVAKVRLRPATDRRSPHGA